MGYMSSGRAAMEGIGGRLAKGVTSMGKRAGVKSMEMGMKSMKTSGIQSTLYKRGAQAASVVARYPGRSAGVGAGAVGAMGIRHMRKRGSQNYPMY